MFIKFLVKTRIVHIALANWLALFIWLPLLYFLGIRLNPVSQRPCREDAGDDFRAALRRTVANALPCSPAREFLGVENRIEDGLD